MIRKIEENEINEVEYQDTEYLETANKSRDTYLVKSKITGKEKLFYEFNNQGLTFSIYDNPNFEGEPLFVEKYNSENNSEDEDERIYLNILKFLKKIKI